MAKTGLHDVREMIGRASMLRTGMLASLIFGFISVAVSAEEAQQLMCTGMMIEPSAMSQSPETVTLTLGPAQKITLDLGQGAYRRPVLHLQIWASDEADVPEA
jgi:hypothetical protein